MQLSNAKQQANQANAQKSTGPKSDQGKQTARQNATKHGLSSAATFLPPDLDHAANEKFAAYAQTLQPQNDLEADLVRRAALAMTRAEACERRQHAEAQARALRADLDREAHDHQEVATWSAQLSQHPAQAVAMLSRSALGCQWLLDSWSDLFGAVDLDPNVNLHLLERAFHLLGIEPDAIPVDLRSRYLIASIANKYDSLPTFERAVTYLLRDSSRKPHTPDLARPLYFMNDPESDLEPLDVLKSLHDMADSTVAQLESRLERLQIVEAAEREAAIASAAVDTSPESMRLARHHNDANRLWQRALKDLRELRKQPKDEAPQEPAQNIYPDDTRQYLLNEFAHELEALQNAQARAETREEPRHNEATVHVGSDSPTPTEPHQTEPTNHTDFRGTEFTPCESPRLPS